MSFFTTEFADFFLELAQNNHKPWFDANKNRYEKHVKQPFHAFIGDMIKRLHEEDPRIQMEPKDAIFRINRDIRFSKDKTPYKTFVSAIIAPGGKNKGNAPGLYLELKPENIGIYGGVYEPGKEDLQRIREAIAADLGNFQRAVSDPDFVATYGSLQGEKQKRLPKELMEAAEQEPLLFNKQFYYYTKLDAEWMLSDKLPEQVMTCYRHARPVREFLEGAFNLA